METPLLFIRNRRILKRELARLRIIFSVEDSPFIRNRRIPKEEIARLRIIFLIEVHGDGDALPFIRESALLSFLLLHDYISFLKLFH